jgi:hypothetical protein
LALVIDSQHFDALKLSFTKTPAYVKSGLYSSRHYQYYLSDMIILFMLFLNNIQKHHFLSATDGYDCIAISGSRNSARGHIYAARIAIDVLKRDEMIEYFDHAEFRMDMMIPLYLFRSQNASTRP